MLKDMNKEVAREWIDAARSLDEKRHARGFLGISNLVGQECFCVMGILCNIAARKGVVVKRKAGRIIEFDGNQGLVPYPVLEWAGIDFNQAQELSLMNDDEDKEITLKELADFIEQQISNLED